MMAQSLDASVSSLMIYRLVRKSFCWCRCMISLLYCTEFFRMEQLPNLVVQFCPCLKNFYCVRNTFWFFMVFCVLDSQFWRRPSTNTLSSQSEFPLYFTLSLNWLCPVFIGLLPPELYIPGRHALSSNYSSSLKQFYTLVENFSNMFVAELAVLSSVSYSCGTVWKVCYFLLLPRSTALELLVLHIWVFMLKKSTALEWLALCFLHCDGVSVAALAYGFSRLMMSITGKVISIIGKIVSIIALHFVQKSRTILAPSWTWSKNEFICWLVVFFCITLCVTGIQNHDMFHSYVTLPFLFCRNHTIWCMPRFDTSLVR